MADWRSHLTFTDRFGQVSKLQQALRLAQPDKANTELKTWPQTTEDYAYQNSTSKTEYEATVVEQIEKQKHSVAANPSQPEEANLSSWEDLSGSSHPSTEKVTFGSYQDAVPFKDGSSSTVFRVPSPSDPTVSYALKVTSPSTQPAPHDSEREVHILQSLRGHSNIIDLVESFRYQSHLVLVFPFLSWSLDLVLSRTNDDLSLPSSRQKSILKDLMTGLSYIHAQGIIHRDIKPSNLLLPHPLIGPARIIDFGTAWSSSSFSSCASEAADAKSLDVGTTSYRAPELLFGNQAYGSSLDMWAAGCVAAEIFNVSSSPTKSLLERSSLFESGDLGSELALIKSIFETLGTPDEESWPETKTSSLPDWGKMKFKQYPRKPWSVVLPHSTDTEREFVNGLVRYESGERMSADEALRHAYLADSNSL